MEEVYVEGKTFDKAEQLAKGEYENCTFDHCVFTDLSNIKFIECTFMHCNLSLATLSNAAFRDVTFNDSKMLGLRFDSCNKFGFDIKADNCNLNNVSFYQMKLIKTKLSNSTMKEADLSECDLSGSVLHNCDLAGAVFDRTVLEKADLRTSYNYSINPENNRIRKAKFSMNGIAGLLDKYDIVIEG